MNHNSSVMSIPRSNAKPISTASFEIKRPLLISGFQPFLRGDNPNLQEVHRLGLRRVVLAMADSCSGAHTLHFPNFDHRAGPRAVLVRERPFKHVSDDLHVLMRVRGKAGTGIHPVFVDESEFAETHMLRIIITAERERVPAIEP